MKRIAVALLVVATACNDVQGPRSPRLEAWPAPPPSGELSGVGQIGAGTNVQIFAFNVQSDATGIKGTFTGRDVGENAQLTTNPLVDPGTFFTAFRSSSSFCATPSLGAEFDAVGHLVEPNVDVYVAYTVKACDNAAPGTGVDTWSVDLPSRGYHKDGSVAGEIVKR
jgi:predicted small secreted protein